MKVDLRQFFYICFTISATFGGCGDKRVGVSCDGAVLFPPSQVHDCSFRLLSEFLAELFEETGLQPVANDYVLRETVNKKEGLSVPRVFLQSKFTKPSQSPSS